MVRAAIPSYFVGSVAGKRPGLAALPCLPGKTSLD